VRDVGACRGEWGLDMGWGEDGLQREHWQIALRRLMR